jgi:hypothetical protein
VVAIGHLMSDVVAVRELWPVVMQMSARKTVQQASSAGTTHFMCHHLHRPSCRNQQQDTVEEEAQIPAKMGCAGGWR